MGNPGTVTLNGLKASIYNGSFLQGNSSSGDYIIDIDGNTKNTIFAKSEKAIEILSSQNVKFTGNGTLTVTATDETLCGITAKNYTSSNNSYDTTNAEVDVSTQLAATGYTVKRSARIENPDGTYTWKYTVKPTNYEDTDPNPRGTSDQI